MALEKRVWHWRRGCGIGEEGVALEKRVWHWRRGCGIGEEGVAS